MGKTEVRFNDGFHEESWWPDYARRANLGHRFAVIQETYRPDSEDMYFDEPLWFAMLDFAQKWAAGVPGTELCFGLMPQKRRGRSHEVAPEPYLTDRLTKSQDDRDPPHYILCRHDGTPSLMIETEFWCYGGGPDLYHDSYAYATYSAVPLGAAVMKYLAEVNDGRWDLAVEPVKGHDGEYRRPRAIEMPRLFWPWQKG